MQTFSYNIKKIGMKQLTLAQKKSLNRLDMVLNTILKISQIIIVRQLSGMRMKHIID